MKAPDFSQMIISETDSQVKRLRPAIYVDVSEWFHSRSATGIQRVLREAVAELQRIERDRPVIPVVAYNGKFHELKGEECRSLMAVFETVGNHPEELKFESRWREVKYRIKKFKPIAFLLINVYSALIAIRKKNKWVNHASVQPNPIDVTEQDVVLLMDAFWPPYLDIESAARWLTDRGGKTVLLVHDLIPMLRPQWSNLIRKFIFKKRLISLAALSSQNLVVSQDQLNKIKKHLPTVDHRKFRVIHLGADGPKGRGGFRDRAEDRHKRESNVFLMVGSLAERKGHNLVLQAFDELYASGHQKLRLIVAGSNVPATGRIKKIIDGSLPAPPYLKLLGEVSDETLAGLYMQASACIFASDDEGFGIPMWEAQHFRTPVIASDIPIFRELGNRNVTYFECGNSLQLADVLRRHTYGFAEVELRTWAHFAAELSSVVDSLTCRQRLLPEPVAGSRMAASKASDAVQALEMP